MNDKLDPRVPLCVRCGCPEAEKLDAREVCQHCAYERKERAVIKRWMTREHSDSVGRTVGRMGVNGQREKGYRVALEMLRIWLDNRDEKERGR